ncbi:MAG: bifunctional isocitrate dehydrogenase kinase/phosphatase [Proteobacteria bacterium]|nr:MAG: bifunctional isocitrate dehydrogenase kinase/phosphatase [Pseudomonadota bacterium]
MTRRAQVYGRALHGGSQRVLNCERDLRDGGLGSRFNKHSVEQRELVSAAANAIYQAFVNYNNNFRRITERAKQRFEKREWSGAQRDLGERIELYTKSVERSVGALGRMLGEHSADRNFWRRLKQFFGDRVNDIPDGEFSKTYFNSVNRRLFNTVGIDPDIEFVTLRLDAEEHHRHLVKHHRYLNWTTIDDIVGHFLNDFAFAATYADRRQDIAFITNEIRRYGNNCNLDPLHVLKIEFMQPVFYQSSRAYLVGQIFWPATSAPLIIALKHNDAGVAVDAVLMSADEVSVLFGFTRSYFFVDVEPVEGAVYFMKSILPQKPLDELYTILGRIRQGKTERYRTFTRHLKQTQDQFVHARGEPGLVMLVFTLPSYDLVFKIIRDSFGYPKNISHEKVMAQYQFVFKHDRAGRLIDTQEFRQIEFPLAKFSPDLLQELLESTSNSVRIDDGKIIIDHLYVERRVTPLNLFVDEQSRESVELAVLDYGQAIKDLALTNIFPGDLLFKNFGVTRHGRVIFYDYDELCLVTDCNFRDLPVPSFDEDEMRPDSWFYVATNDVFPAEFIKFLSMNKSLKALFLEVHADLLTADYWRAIKTQHLENQILEVVPYYHPPLPTRRN